MTAAVRRCHPPRCPSARGRRTAAHRLPRFAPREGFSSPWPACRPSVAMGRPAASNADRSRTARSVAVSVTRGHRGAKLAACPRSCSARRHRSSRRCSSAAGRRAWTASTRSGRVSCTWFPARASSTPASRRSRRSCLTRRLERPGCLLAMGEFNLGESEHDFRVPDGGLHRPGAAGVWHATAALVVEILSPGDESLQKLPFYAAHHVDEVLLVDPAERTRHVARAPRWRVRARRAKRADRARSGRARRAARLAVAAGSLRREAPTASDPGTAGRGGACAAAGPARRSCRCDRCRR